MSLGTRTTLELIQIQRAFIDQYLTSNEKLLDVNIKLSSKAPVIMVECREDADLDRIELPHTFRGLRVEVFAKHYAPALYPQEAYSF